MPYSRHPAGLAHWVSFGNTLAEPGRGTKQEMTLRIPRTAEMQSLFTQPRAFLNVRGWLSRLGIPHSALFWRALTGTNSVCTSEEIIEIPLRPYSADASFHRPLGPE